MKTIPERKMIDVDEYDENYNTQQNLGMFPGVHALRSQNTQNGCPGCGEIYLDRKGRLYNGYCHEYENGETPVSCPDCGTLYYGYSKIEYNGEAVLWPYRVMK